MQVTRRKLLSSAIAAAALWVAAALTAQSTAAAFKVGMTRRTFIPPAPYHWRGDPKHVLVTMIWYPAAPDTHERPQRFRPPGRPFFNIGPTARNAPLAAAPEKLPLIVLSHGFGAKRAISPGSATRWRHTAIYTAAAVSHLGNNAIDGNTVPGATLWWLRARDLSTVIDGMLANPMFGPRIDKSQIGAAGGYTVIEIAGGITSRAHFRAACASPEADKQCAPPREFPRP
jgi:predicted dienelactone hydrolase